jgi:hypothetical protein
MAVVMAVAKPAVAIVHIINIRDEEDVIGRVYSDIKTQS